MLWCVEQAKSRFPLPHPHCLTPTVSPALPHQRCLTLVASLPRSRCLTLAVSLSHPQHPPAPPHVSNADGWYLQAVRRALGHNDDRASDRDTGLPQPKKRKQSSGGSRELCGLMHDVKVTKAWDKPLVDGQDELNVHLHQMLQVCYCRGCMVSGINRYPCFD